MKVDALRGSTNYVKRYHLREVWLLGGEVPLGGLRKVSVRWRDVSLIGSKTLELSDWLSSSIRKLVGNGDKT